MWAFTWQFLMCQKSQAWPAVACKKNKKQKKNLHPKKEKSEFHPLIVFPYDCNVLHAWLCGPMSPLVSRPVWYAASSAIAMTLFPDLKPWGFRAKSALTQWVPPVLVWKVSWDIFWTAYMPQMEFLPLRKLAVVGNYITLKLPSLVNWCTLGFLNVLLSLVSIQAAAFLFLCCWYDSISMLLVCQNMKAWTYVSSISKPGEVKTVAASPEVI